MLTIYHVPGTRGVRAIWVCEELALPYTVESVDFSPEFRASESLARDEPSGQGARAERFRKCLVKRLPDVRVRRHGAVHLGSLWKRPVTSPSLAHLSMATYLQWSWFAEATFARPLGEIVNHGREFPGTERIDAVVEEMQNRAQVCAQAVGAAVADRTFILWGAVHSRRHHAGLHSDACRPFFYPKACPPALCRTGKTCRTGPAYQKAVS